MNEEQQKELYESLDTMADVVGDVYTDEFVQVLMSLTGCVIEKAGYISHDPRIAIAARGVAIRWLRSHSHLPALALRGLKPTHSGIPDEPIVNARYRIVHRSPSQRCDRVSVMTYLGEEFSGGRSFIFDARPEAGTQKMPFEWIKEMVRVIGSIPHSLNRKIQP